MELKNDSKSQTCAIFDIREEAGRVVLNKVTGNPAASKFGELPFLNDSKIQKQRVVDSAASSSSTGKPMPSIREARKPSTLISESNAPSHREECTSTALPAIEKPKWNGGQPYLPAIKPEKKQKVEDFLEKQ